MKTLLHIKTKLLTPNRKTARLLKKAREDYKKGRNISPIFETAKEITAYLHREP